MSNGRVRRGWDLWEKSVGPTPGLAPSIFLKLFALSIKVWYSYDTCFINLQNVYSEERIRFTIRYFIYSFIVRSYTHFWVEGVQRDHYTIFSSSFLIRIKKTIENDHKYKKYQNNQLEVIKIETWNLDTPNIIFI